METKDVIGMKCIYDGAKWEIVSMTRNALGTYYGIKRHASTQVVKSSLVYLLNTEKANKC